MVALMIWSTAYLSTLTRSSSSFGESNSNSIISWKNFCCHDSPRCHPQLRRHNSRNQSYQSNTFGSLVVLHC